MHILEAGFEDPDRPCVLLLHGFPELAYSWRKVMLPLAAAGYYVVAPDQRGYGRTTGWDFRLYLREKRLGRLPTARQPGTYAAPCLYATAGLPPARRGRTLGAAGAAGAGE